MSWSARTWQPTIRRDGPLIVVAAFFLMPALFFFTAWYADYFPGATSRLVVVVAGALALLAPPAVCFRLAGRAGRRRSLWAVLVLAGVVLALWLPTRYLILGGPLPPAAYVALPMALRGASAATLVSLIPLLMGTIPVVVYGLALGLDRPMAGVPPRGAVILMAAGGAALWAGALFLTLLNPAAPPLVPLDEQIDVMVRVTRPPALPGEIVPQTWSALLWRLHDGLPPGATGIRREEDGFRLRLPAVVERQELLGLLMGRGAVELVSAGDTPPAAGTQVSTTRSPLGGADETLETVVIGEELLQDLHWSGVRVGRVTLEEGTDTSVMIVAFSSDGHQTLERFAEGNRGAFLSLVVDNVALASFPVLGAIETDTLVIRRLEPEIARSIAAIMRYGPLPLVPDVEIVR